MTKRTFYHSVIFMAVALAALLLPILVMDAGAIDLVAANQLTVAWDPVTTNSDGSDLGPGQVVEYQVYVQKFMAANQTPQLVGSTEDTNYTVGFPGEGVWQFGLASKKYEMISDPDGGPDKKIYSEESVVVWSIDPAVCQNGVTFAGVYLKIPGEAGGLHTQ